MVSVSKVIVMLFGLFIVAVRGLMLFSPGKARIVLRKAASTPLIHFAEISLRMIPAATLIIAANISKFPLAFKLLGWIMLITSVVLFFVPYKLHHNYALYWGDKLNSLMFRLISPFAVLLGSLLVYGVL